MNKEQEHIEEEGTIDATTQDVSFEEVNEDLPAQAGGVATIKRLREKIKDLEKESKTNLDGWTRANADYANLKREAEKNRKEDIKFANKKLILELLPVLDAYDMAKGNSEAWNKVDQNWRVGIEYIFNQLISIFEREGVTQFGAVGDMFDPNLHESIEHVPVTDEKQNNMLVDILQKGYKVGDVILRPARVKTGEYKP